jgi:hypothetical protein
MKFKKVVAFIVTTVCALLITTSCSSTRVYYPTSKRAGHGPPPHAPAHGYRRKQVHGVELVFDSQLGVYVVIGHPGHYYYDGYFYRLKGGVWEMSLKIEGGWGPKSAKPLPPGLRNKSYAKANGNANGKSKNHGKAVVKGKHKGR